MKRELQPLGSPSPVVNRMLEAAKGGLGTRAEMEALRAKIAARVAAGAVTQAPFAAGAGAKIAIGAIAIAIVGAGIIAFVAPWRERAAVRRAPERIAHARHDRSEEAREDRVAPAPPDPTPSDRAEPDRTQPIPIVAPRPRAIEAPSEMELLNRAQAALASTPARTLVVLAEHRRVYPNGLLAQEREVLAVEALVRLGRSARAQARARDFERRWPTSGYVRRLRVLVGTSSSEGSAQ